MATVKIIFTDQDGGNVDVKVDTGVDALKLEDLHNGNATPAQVLAITTMATLVQEFQDHLYGDVEVNNAA